jgi:hypothetical protein
VTPGHRLRVLAELYDPLLSEREAVELAGDIKAVLVERFANITVVTYVEANPPADEIGS